MYNYETEKQNLFTEQGQRMFLSIRDNVKNILKESGAIMMQNAISGQSGSTWTMLACVDRLVELEEIKEINQKGVAGQHRVFVSITN